MDAKGHTSLQTPLKKAFFCGRGPVDLRAKDLGSVSGENQFFKLSWTGGAVSALAIACTTFWCASIDSVDDGDAFWTSDHYYRSCKSRWYTVCMLEVTTKNHIPIISAKGGKVRNANSFPNRFWGKWKPKIARSTHATILKVSPSEIKHPTGLKLFHLVLKKRALDGYSAPRRSVEIMFGFIVSF